MSLDPHAYFEDVLVFLLGASAYAETLGDPLEYRFGEDLALLEAAIGYEDSSRIHIHLLVDTSSGYPDVRHYSYHFEDSSGQTLFRYDNSRHHPELPHFPNHKHEGPLETCKPSQLPSLRRLQTEIQDKLRRIRLPR